MSDGWQETITNAEVMRRDLHAHPELGWQEYRTADRIRETLSRLNIAWRACAGTGTLAWLNPTGKGPHLALRGDIDALPLTENSQKNWTSQRPGCMHACGHDGHTATLIATAHWLKMHESLLPGPVTLIFQPAEEGGHGAREMIHDGALDGIDAIYGWHNWPAIPFGKLVCPGDIVMAGNGTFELIINGLGGHASQPELCRDPVLAASAITLNLQQIISRRLPPQQAAVLSVTSIEAPSAPTVIPQQAKIGGSIRVPDKATRETLNRLITEISQQTAISYGVHCEVNIYPRYEATTNHALPALQVREQWQTLFGFDAVHSDIRLPIMASEDFSYYLQEIPGAFALIGSDDGPEHQAPCHSPYYDFNDRLIPLVTALFARLCGAPVPENLPNVGKA